MRVSIRDQLAALVIFSVLISLAIVSIPTWIFVHNFVTGVESDGLSLTASLKAAKVTSELNLLTTLSQTITTRILLQQAFTDFYNGNATLNDTFAAARSDLESAMSTSSLTGLLQARLYSRNQTGGTLGGLLNVTGGGVGAQSRNIHLPYLTPNGSRVNLSDTEYGYPPSLYPNISYQTLDRPNPYVPSTPAVAAYAFPGVMLSNSRGLVLGPLLINDSFALISVTMPIRSLSLQGFILGYMTLVSSATSLIDAQSTREGLGSTGSVLLVGPAQPSNRFAAPQLPANSTYKPPENNLTDVPVRFVLPAIPIPGQSYLHQKRAYDGGDYSASFPLSQYPGLLDVYSKYNSQPNNAQAHLSSSNEEDFSVAVGAARVSSDLVDWAVVVEQTESEAYHPIGILRKILLGCVFGTAGLVILLIFPCAHFSVRPVRRLKMATTSSINPPGYEEYVINEEDKGTPSSGGTLSSASIRGLFKSLRRWFKKTKRAMTQAEIDNHRRAFKIPGRVKESRHFITDELTELTAVYNRMSDELVKQYTSLDAKVADRTRQLEISKKAAEAANESKTLFIANISHELKTPLNGIMGICAVCMEDDDIRSIQRSLKTLYRSGELLLHLLEDLLSFSKNQISHQVRLEERQFRLGEVRTQVLSIFDKQARESKIALEVLFLSSENSETTKYGGVTELTSLSTKSHAVGPPELGRIRDVYLCGDQHRILQVLINLVNNSLKFTPAEGKIQVRIRCVGQIEPQSGSDESRSTPSNAPSRMGRTRFREDGGGNSVGSGQSTTSKGTSISANKGDSPNAAKDISHVLIEEKSRPPWTNAQSYIFEFEVEDNGRGIPEDMLEKVFEPFVQVDSSLSKEFGGTGLGLSICSQLAKLMEGSITVKSTANVGSTFCLRIPLKHVKDRVMSTTSGSTRSASRATSVGGSTNGGGGSHRNSLSSVLADPEVTTAVNAAEAASAARGDNHPRLVGLSTPFFAPKPNQATVPAATPSISGASPDETKAAIQRAKADKAAKAGDDKYSHLRVLVADDNSTNIEVVRRMLKLEQVHNVLIAKDGQEAYDLVKANMAENQAFDLIFMDVQMPNVDGLQSTRLIRKMGYAAPIVALTAFSDDTNRKECMESGMDEFLAKPIRRPALKHVLTKFATIPEEDHEECDAKIP